MAKIHPGATLTPHFREFLPVWVAAQPWYRGSGDPTLTPVGYFRFEDPAGEVGIETQLVADGSVLYQIPMTYRGAPLASASLITTAEHSVLGTRWIYDAETDPVWQAELRRLIADNGVSDPSQKRGVGPAEARGQRITDPLPDNVIIELCRVPLMGRPAPDPSIVGLVFGTWYPEGPGTRPDGGCLGIARHYS
jgi:hypothetical protein